MGDINNGVHSILSSFRNIEIDDPNTPIQFNFQIVNQGNNNGEVEDRLKTTGDFIAGGLAGAAGLSAAVGGTLSPTPVGWGLLIAAGALETLSLIWTFSSVDCDGPVAGDVIEDTWANIKKALMDGKGHHVERRFF